LRADTTGTIVLTAALLAMFYPLIEGRQLGWPAWSLALLVASIPLFALFVLTQARYTRGRRAGRVAPLVDLELFRSRATSTGLAIALLLFGSTSFFFVLTLHLQNGLGYSALRTGLTFLPFSIGIIFGAGAASPLGQRFGRGALAGGAATIALALISMMALIAHYRTGLHPWQLAPSLTIVGLAFGIISGTLADIVLSQVPARLADSASGVVNTVTELGSVVAITVSGAIYFGIIGSHPAEHTFVHATTASLWYLAITCAIAAPGCALLPKPSSTVPDRRTSPATPAASGHRD
jgi:MFS family permease